VFEHAGDRLQASLHLFLVEEYDVLGPLSVNNPRLVLAKIFARREQKLTNEFHGFPRSPRITAELVGRLYVKSGIIQLPESHPIISHHAIKLIYVATLSRGACIK
jgi:hypothetical protein